MLITKDRKRLECQEIFQSYGCFIKYVDENISSLNINNEDILNKLSNVYVKILSNDGVIQYRRLSRFIVASMSFKKKNVKQLEFWIERGWSEEISLEKMSEINSKMGKTISDNWETRLSDKIDIVINSNTLFKYKGHDLLMSEFPHCNICNSKLELKKVNINNTIKNYYYKIISCQNLECESHKHSKTQKYRDYLPEKEGKKIIKDLHIKVKENNILSIEYYIKRGKSKKEAISIISGLQSKNSSLVKNRFIRSKENLSQNGFTKEEIEDICITPYMTIFWIKRGYSKEESVNKVRQLQLGNSTKLQLARKNNPEKYKGILPTQLEYWIKYTNGDINKAKELLKERQTTFSYDKCIEKHGEHEGLRIFNSRQEKWIESIKKNGNLKCGYSSISQELFEILNEKVPNNKFEYATNKGELKIKRNNMSFYLYDFIDTKTKRIIEFNGDVFHANPSIYEANDNPHPFKKDLISSEIWGKDKLKKELAISKGYKYLVVWESDYIKEPNGIINKCIKFLKQ